jgi:peptidylprolyl isomerase
MEKSTTNKPIFNFNTNTNIHIICLWFRVIPTYVTLDCYIHHVFVYCTEWSPKALETNINPSSIRPPTHGNRIILELFWDVAPLACENFSKLCCHHYSSSRYDNSNKSNKIPLGECGKPLTYRGSTIHRVVPGFVMQGGDFVFGNGSGGESVFGGNKKSFKDERAGLLLKHDRRGILSMGNSGKNSNTSQFFITFGPVPQCDTKHVIFGRVISGFDVLRAVEMVGNTSSKGDERPSVSVVITECGVFEPLLTPPAGYWFDQPDADSFLGSTPVFMCRPRVVLVVPTVIVSNKCKQSFGSFVMCVATIVVSSEAATCGTITTDWEQQQRDKIIIIKDEIEKMMEDFMVDIVVAAPACADSVASVSIPESWISRLGRPKVTANLVSNGVVVIAKPSNCLFAVRKSWINQLGWTLDGAVQ